MMNSKKRSSHLRLVTDEPNITYDAATFERYYRESYRTVYGYTYSLVLNRDDADDIVSEAFFKAARAFTRFDPSKAAFSTWVCTIARNLVYSRARTQQRRGTFNESELEFDFTTVASYDEEPDFNEDANLAQKLLAVLTEEERNLVYLKVYEELSNKEIAARLGMNASTVGTKLSRAMAKMRSAAK